MEVSKRSATGLGFRGGGGKQFGGASAGNTNGAGAITNTDYRWNSAVTTAANTVGGSKGEGIAGTPVYIPNIIASTTTTGTLEDMLMAVWVGALPAMPVVAEPMEIRVPMNIIQEAAEVRMVVQVAKVVPAGKTD